MNWASVEERIAVDRMWRDPKQRKAFEAETGLTDEMTAEYHDRFCDWAAAKRRAAAPN